MDTALFNILTRQQVYVEGVKNWFAIDLNRYIKLLRDYISQQLRKLNVKSLGELSKAGISAFLRKIDKRSNEILSGYGTEFLSELRRFGRVSLAGQRSAFALALPKVDTSGLSLSSIWSATKDRIVPAFGSTVKDGATTLVATARDKIRQRLNTGYADSESVQDTEAAVTNLDPAGDPSTLKTIAATARSFVSTAIQHAVSTVSDFVGAVIHDCYQWCSVIDSKTSPICRDRNGQIYRYGEGPVPPAHPHCRSHTVPVSCGDKGDVPTFYNWLLNQPKDFLSDAFGASFARKVADGSVTAKDVPDAIAYPALSLDEYELKAKFLAA
jgi:SPP1 gp7 family putative phage head morphogenesis protein